MTRAQLEKLKWWGKRGHLSAVSSAGSTHHTPWATPLACIPPHTHVQGPFTYEALPPQMIKFVPLKQTLEFQADELMQVRPGMPTCCERSSAWGGVVGWDHVGRVRAAGSQ